MRKALATTLLTLIGLVALAVGLPAPAVAQGTFPPAIVYAEQFNNWSYPSQGANQFTFAYTNNCESYPLANAVPPYFVFGGGTYGYYPVLIQDANPADSEIVTPTAVTRASGSCGFSAAPANSHTSFTVSSGTAGLQDAVGTLAGGASSGIVGIDSYFYRLVAALPGSETVGKLIYGLKGSSNVQVVDTTTSPWTYYAWNGSHYFANGGGTPTAALGTGAGTSPTGPAISGNGAGGTVTLTAGTSPTASATIFTLTYPSGTSSTGFNHQPTCTITSVGASSYTVGTLTYSGSASAGYVVTVPATATALTAATQYSFAYSCE